MWISATFFYVHSTIICPPTTIGGILALWPQWHNAKVLDIVGLTCQVVVFAFVALSWIPRVRFRVDLGEGPQNISDVWNLIVVWYQLVGWAAVDNAIFAIVQLILLCLANYQGGGVRSCGRPTEEEPLLEGQADACVVK